MLTIVSGERHWASLRKGYCFSNNGFQLQTKWGLHFANPYLWPVSTSTTTQRGWMERITKWCMRSCWLHRGQALHLTFRFPGYDLQEAEGKDLELDMCDKNTTTKESNCIIILRVFRKVKEVLYSVYTSHCTMDLLRRVASLVFLKMKSNHVVCIAGGKKTRSTAKA